MGVWVAHILIVKTKKLRFFRILLCVIVVFPFGCQSVGSGHTYRSSQKFSPKRKLLKRLWNFLFICLCVTEETAHSIPSFSSPPLPKTKQNKTTPVDRATLPSHPLPFSFWEKLHSHTTLLLICREVLVVVVPHAFYFSATNCVFRHCLASTIVKCPCLDI